MRMRKICHSYYKRISGGTAVQTLTISLKRRDISCSERLNLFIDSNCCLFENSYCAVRASYKHAPR